ncbi:unnamed protein product [Nesidiocoris tenuis]|uniref:Uncharacterized protein n=1 Tax=Nesidiocoris tenuis TaxID=355587 RepID=A0A6H5H8I8_9HEMI|nr:unnamed protein product [Nesidiocoris tenuis]
MNASDFSFSLNHLYLNVVNPNLFYFSTICSGRDAEKHERRQRARPRKRRWRLRRPDGRHGRRLRHRRLRVRLEVEESRRRRADAALFRNADRSARAPQLCHGSEVAE